MPLENGAGILYNAEQERIGPLSRRPIPYRGTMTYTYRIAGVNIGITSIYEAVHCLCADYRTDGEADFRAEITRADLDRERARASSEVSEEYLETLAVYRRIAERMPAYDTVLMHGSALAVDGEGVLFTAKSGVGKSTHARLWREVFGGRVVMVNDDKPLLRITGAGVTVFGTPWNGKHRLGENIAAPLKAVCFLERAEKNTVREIAGSEAYPLLIRQIYRPADPLMLEKTLALIDRLADSVGLYRLGCTMDREAAEVAYSGMKGSLRN